MRIEIRIASKEAKNIMITIFGTNNYNGHNFTSFGLKNVIEISDVPPYVHVLSALLDFSFSRLIEGNIDISSVSMSL